MLEILSHLKEGATVITPNNRLSKKLETQFLQTIEKELVPQPLCFPFTRYVHLLYEYWRMNQTQISHPLILSPAQERFIWSEIIKNDPDITPHDGLIQEVMDAFKRIEQWQVDIHHDAFKEKPQTAQYQTWHLSFLKQTKELGYISEDQLLNHLLQSGSSINPYDDACFGQIASLKSNQQLKSCVIWYCFDELTPQQKALQRALDAAGIKQIEKDVLEPSNESRDIQVYSTQNAEDEIHHVLHWLKETLLSGKKRIVWIVPHLESQATKIERHIHDAFDESLINISLGKKLLDYPLVSHAIEWLRLKQSQLKRHQINLLLFSSFLKSAETEFIRRSDFLEKHHNHLDEEIRTADFCKLLEGHCPILAKIILELVDYPSAAKPSEWAIFFKTRLRNLGFPGESPLNSASFQCFERFMDLIDEFSKLDFLRSQFSAKMALATFETMAKQTIFQAKIPETQIEVLGLLEASGCTFDALWMSGLTDQSFPKKAQASAFIPLSLQKTLNMPHSSSHREWTLATKLWDRILRSADQCFFSYPEMQGDCPMRPSSLMSHHDRISLPVRPNLQNETELTEMDEDYCIALNDQEMKTASVSLLANQARCPFKAFAAQRLAAKKISPMRFGPDLALRGQMLHRILELLWLDLKDQDGLLSHTPETLKELIKQLIHSTLEKMTATYTQTFPPICHEVEISRLSQMIEASLDWERNRSYFKIAALEKTFHFDLAGLEFKLRIDRIDELSSAENWVIDYKTTLPPKKNWFDERPEFPQLLVYALILPSIHSLIYLEFKNGQIRASGIAKDDPKILGISPIKNTESWEDLRQIWHERLTHLANEYQRGESHPKPKHDSICQTCDFPALCRIKGP